MHAWGKESKRVTLIEKKVIGDYDDESITQTFAGTAHYDENFNPVDTDTSHCSDLLALQSIATVLKYAIITMCGLILFTLANDSANAERISNSVGGEAVFVLLPVLWWIIEGTIKDSVAEARKAKRNRNERTWR